MVFLRKTTLAHAEHCRYDAHRDHSVPIPDTGSISPSKRKPWDNKYGELPWAERRSRLVDALLSTGDLHIVGFQVSSNCHLRLAVRLI